MEYILNQVFYLANDGVWLGKIQMEQLGELYDLLEFESIYDSTNTNSILSEMLIAMHLITQRISGRAMETDVIKMVPEFDDCESPFSAFEKELFLIEDVIRNSENHYISSDDISYAQLLVLHKHCQGFVEKAFHNSSKYGISLGLFFGLNLDVRHITFASGNLALGLYGANYEVSNSMLFWGIFGIGIIGLVNFMVSFSLSLGLAFRSRAISLFELRFGTVSIWNHFKSRPISFFFPTEEKRKSVVVENYLHIEEGK